jgi:ABC-type transport system involved in multi-copper enzyme maturation permease subunit
MRGEGVGPAFVRDVGLVARFELAEALRSRLLIVMVLLFVGAGALSAWVCTRIISSVEENAAKVMGAPETKQRGALFRRLRDAGSYRAVLTILVRDPAKAAYFAAIPPIVVFFGWSMFMFTPFLVLLASAESIATDVGSRAIRYSVLRTGRLQFALGKALGQLAIVGGVTLLSALVYYLIAWASLSHFEHQATALGMLSYWPRVLVFLLPFLGWAMFASMVTRSANFARILALGGGAALVVLANLAENPPRWLRGGPLSDALRALLSYLTPFGHNDGLSYPPGGAFASDIAVCLALTVLYFAAGYTFLRKRDL